MSGFISEAWGKDLADGLRESMLKNLEFWFPPSTEEERARWAREKAAAQPRLHKAMAGLRTLDDLERELVELHCDDDGKCAGCDFSGFEADPPDWPCRTVQHIAEYNGWNLGNFYLYDPDWEPED
jgi:hypothetical protein